MLKLILWASLIRRHVLECWSYIEWKNETRQSIISAEWVVRHCGDDQIRWITDISRLPSRYTVFLTCVLLRWDRLAQHTASSYEILGHARCNCCCTIPQCVIVTQTLIAATLCRHIRLRDTASYCCYIIVWVCEIRDLIGAILYYCMRLWDTGSPWCYIISLYEIVRYGISLVLHYIIVWDCEIRDLLGTTLYHCMRLWDTGSHWCYIISFYEMWDMGSHWCYIISFYEMWDTGSP